VAQSSGILLDALREGGRERNTVVCLWGDHGMHLGEHGLWRKYTLFENACRGPLVIAAPGVAKEGAACRRPVELIDMYPTLAELYDHDADPGEHTNLARLPEHAEAVARLSRLLRAGWKAALPEGTG